MNITAGYFTVPWSVIEALVQAKLDRSVLSVGVDGGGRISATSRGVIVQWAHDPNTTSFPLPDPDRYEQG